ncbi:hypothetical protein DSUL_140044 [Desulfovibrionales bacterium]
MLEQLGLYVNGALAVVVTRDAWSRLGKIACILMVLLFALPYGA